MPGRNGSLPEPLWARSSLRFLLVTPFLILGASGWTAHFAFANSTIVKYLLTIAAPLGLAAFALVPQPFLVLVAAVVLAAPAATLEVSFSGVSLTAIAATCLLAAVPVVLGLTRPVGTSALGRVLPVSIALAIIPMAHGVRIGETVTVAVTALAVAFLCARAIRQRGGLAVVLLSTLGSLLLQAVLAIWEYRTRKEFDLYSGSASATATNYFFDYQSQPRPTGTFSDPISLATALAVAIPIGLAMLHLLLQRHRWLPASAVGIAIALIGLGLALSLSRMATIGAAISLVVVIALVPRWSRLRMAQIVGGALATLLIGALVVGGPSLIERLSSISDPTATGVATADGDRDRLFYWSVAAETGLEHPIAGVGAGHLNEILIADAPDAGVHTHAHSAYLQIFAEGGLLGLASLALLAFGLLVDLRRAHAHRPTLTSGLAGAVVALAVAGVTDVVTIKYVAVAATVAPILGMIVGLAGRGIDERDN